MISRNSSPNYDQSANQNFAKIAARSSAIETSSKHTKGGTIELRAMKVVLHKLFCVVPTITDEARKARREEIAGMKL